MMLEAMKWKGGVGANFKANQVACHRWLVSDEKRELPTREHGTDCRHVT